jgi:tRNA (guanine-N7-)-methyltransferase
MDLNMSKRIHAAAVLLSLEVDPSSLPATVDWEALFGRSGPVELEIGFGKGSFLLAVAPEFPERNYFGLEVSRKYGSHTASRLEREGVANVRLCRMEASYFLGSYVPSESLEAIHVYHPDPWPKKRHHKRRLVRQEFLKTGLSRIVPGGWIHVSTDHNDYFEFMKTEVAALSRSGVPFEVTYSEGPEGPEEVVTYYARKYHVLGSTIHRIDIQKPET